MSRISPPANGAASPTIRVWGLTEAGKPLRHPGNGRAPGDVAAGVSVPNDAFTARRIVDGDWTATDPNKAAPAADAKPAKAVRTSND